MAAMYAVPGETLSSIANAIRGKTGSDDFMTVSSMSSAIEGIDGGSLPPRCYAGTLTNLSGTSVSIDTNSEYTRPICSCLFAVDIDSVNMASDNESYVCGYSISLQTLESESPRLFVFANGKADYYSAGVNFSCKNGVVTFSNTREKYLDPNATYRYFVMFY